MGIEPILPLWCNGVSTLKLPPQTIVQNVKKTELPEIALDMLNARILLLHERFCTSLVAMIHGNRMDSFAGRQDIKITLQRFKLNCICRLVNRSLVARAFIGVGNDEFDSRMDALDVAQKQSDCAGLAKFWKRIT